MEDDLSETSYDDSRFQSEMAQDVKLAGSPQPPNEPMRDDEETENGPPTSKENATERPQQQYPPRSPTMEQLVHAEFLCGDHPSDHHGH